MALRVFVPDKRDAAINEVLKELYLLRQAIDYQSGTTKSRLSMVDQIRSKLKDIVEDSPEK
tara:strand:- start:92 stop:274 length:183 start_codon:yes stop_codon:yes gene_type:complete